MKILPTNVNLESGLNDPFLFTGEGEGNLESVGCVAHGKTMLWDTDKIKRILSGIGIFILRTFRT